MSKNDLQQEASNLGRRQLQIQNNIRCLDCEGMTNSIQYVQSPIATEQRQVVNTMLRKGFTDKEIYEEISGIYGKHCFNDVFFIDGESLKYKQIKQIKSIAELSLYIGIGVLTYKFGKNQFKNMLKK
ncbi:hypothetical protein IMG5_187190 [Ichthyophthirius multifiliis]|uniref:CcmH/CycL/Ccl2/NrfF N-terminal domain-containing protein n=1 Tax=Ichthyophthirius multifiliis TaxID=5932 RepID=G0R3Q8_ICHMU|nr:hypothetical protein IMG5_187190 [Ichthyophthirius multifiliis]EGR27875.1 hypothetical protein IMG5_187190 [Ichthyophthirius multifiliis]|eukprot:XP_004027220.1 hypothetical protein IMG5_187190 [Ichthyophthirius multifiliis]